LVLLEADGALVTKEEFLKTGVAGHCCVGREPQGIRIIHRGVVISTEGATTTATVELMLFSLMLHDAQLHRF
jgi:hypothetical protein